MSFIHVKSPIFDDSFDADVVVEGAAEDFSREAGIDMEHVTSAWDCPERSGTGAPEAGGRLAVHRYGSKCRQLVPRISIFDSCGGAGDLHYPSHQMQEDRPALQRRCHEVRLLRSGKEAASARSQCQGRTNGQDSNWRCGAERIIGFVYATIITNLRLGTPFTTSHSR